MNKMLCKLTIVSAFLLGVNTAHALAIPQGSKLDPRIQIATYNASQVYHVKAAVGRAVLVQFEDGEVLDEESGLLGMGDSQAWNLAVKGNNILFKPLAANPDTNLIVNTNKRTYVFQLSVEEKGGQADTYVLRFHYPDTVAANRAAELAKQQQVQSILDGEHVYADRKNQDYWGYGDKELAPTAMYDDGRFTYIDFNNNRDMPSVYKIMPDGTESLVNYHVKGYTVVVHELAQTFILRLGEKVLGINNRGFNESGHFNHLGTGNDNEVRLVKPVLGEK